MDLTFKVNPDFIFQVEWIWTQWTSFGPICRYLNPQMGLTVTERMFFSKSGGCPRFAKIWENYICGVKSPPTIILSMHAHSSLLDLQTWWSRYQALPTARVPAADTAAPGGPVTNKVAPSAMGPAVNMAAPGGNIPTWELPRDPLPQSSGQWPCALPPRPRRQMFSGLLPFYHPMDRGLLPIYMGSGEPAKKQ